jgi:hypothetical protein
VSYSTPKLAPTPKAHKAIGKSRDSTFLTKVLDALRGISWPKEYSYRFLKNKLSDEWADWEVDAFRAFGTLSAKYARWNHNRVCAEQSRSRADINGRYTR